MNLPPLHNHINAHQVIAVDMGKAAIASHGEVLKSFGFKNCNCFLLKNADSGEAMLMHVQYATEDPRDKMTGLVGITPAMEQQLDAFLAKPGRKVGISLYKPWHYEIDQGNHGGQNDHLVTAYLKERGVSMRRCAVPYFQLTDSPTISREDHMDPRRWEAFDVAYDPKLDRLEINALSTPEAAPIEVAPDTISQWMPLAVLKPFSNLRLFDQPEARSR